MRPQPRIAVRDVECAGRWYPAGERYLARPRAAQARTVAAGA